MAIDVLGSRMPAKNGYGQNGFAKASSDLPGEATSSGFLPGVDVAAAARETIGGDGNLYPLGRSGKAPPRAPGPKDAGMQGPQTRTLGGANVPTAFGMRNPNK
jgi:hypothetical protein